MTARGVVRRPRTLAGARSNQVMRFPGSQERDSAVDSWFARHSDDLGAIARHWFDVMRECGDDVRELLHDGQPTACVGDGAFGYVDAFRHHVNIGFFRGRELRNPAGLLEGSGKYMRHVKLRPGGDFDPVALRTLVVAAYADMRRRQSFGGGRE